MKREPDIRESEATAAPLLSLLRQEAAASAALDGPRGVHTCGPACPCAARRLSRATDPGTSHAAARDIVGDLPKLHAEALAAVRAHPDRTARELEDMAGVPRSTYGRRLPELAAAGKVVRLPARRCTVTGRMAETWAAVENDRNVT